MTTLYLIRHGQTEWNVQKRMQGWQDSPLTELGVRHANWLSESLREVDFEAIYSSPSLRAWKTADILRGQRELDILTEEGLREIHVGDWEGQVISDLEKACPEQLAAFWGAPHLYQPNSGETFADVHYRAIGAIKKILDKHEQNVLIVAHTVTIKLIMAYFEGRTLEQLWDPPIIKDTSLCVVEIAEERVEIILHGDTSHYQGESSQIV